MKKFLSLFLSLCLFLHTGIIVKASEFPDTVSEENAYFQSDEFLGVNDTLNNKIYGTVGDFVYTLAQNEPIVEPRFSSIRISWTPINGMIYEVYRGESADTVNEKISGTIPLPIGTSEYIDENAGQGKIWFYKVKVIINEEKNTIQTLEISDNGILSDAVSNSQPTGLLALQGNAKFNKVFTGENTKFDGKKELSYDTEASRISGLKQGTVVMRIKLDSTISGIKRPIFSVGNGKFFSWLDGGKEKFRYEFPGFMSGAATLLSFDTWYTIVYTSKELVANPLSTSVMVSINGVKDATSYNSNFKGFFGYLSPAPTTVKIGGVTDGFKGEISYVTVTDQVLSEAEMNELSGTNAPPFPNDTTPPGVIAPDTKVTNFVVEPRFNSIRLNWTPIDGATYEVYRGLSANTATEKISGATALPDGTEEYIDTTAGTDKTWFYRVKITQATAYSDAVSNTEPTGLNAIQINSQFNKDFKNNVSLGGISFDGTRVETYGQTELDSIKNLEQGTVILKMKVNINHPNYNDTKETQIFNAGPSSYFSYNPLDAKNAVRILFPGGAKLKTELVNDNAWHTVVYNADKKVSEIRLSMDGNKVSQGIWTNSAFLFFAGASPTIPKIGNEFIGDIAYVIVTDEVLTLDEMNALSTPPPSESGIEKLFNDESGNIWVFTGGVNVAGGLEQIQGARNFVGHFEEHIRWVKRNTNNDKTLERYTINTGKAGQKVEDINNNYESIVNKYKPRAVAIFVGAEDYNNGDGGLVSFETNLKSLINKIKLANAVPVIQTPIPDTNSSYNTNAEKYANKIKDIGGADDKIVVVDHFQLCTDNNIKSIDGLLNQSSHIKIAEQLMDSTIGNHTTFTLGETVDAVPKTRYLETIPTIISTENSISVTIPNNSETIGISSWKYELKTNGQTMKDTVSNSFNITDLTTDSDYELSIYSSDKSKQLKTVTGNIAVDSVVKGEFPWQFAKKHDKADTVNILLSDTSQPLTWLFLGDSITHGAQHTKGYDSLPQLFEKYVRDEKGRKDDVIINTGVSGSTTVDFLNNKQFRYDAYKDNADVVFIMFGTNDCVKINLNTFKDNLKTIINMVKSDGAIPIIRTPNPCIDAGDRGKKIVDFVNVIRDVATEEDVILVDHYSQWDKAKEEYPAIIKVGNLMGDVIHPGASGQLNMLHGVIQTLGLWNETGNLEKLAYEMPVYKTPESSSIIPVISKTDAKISVETANLTGAMYITVEAKLKNGTKLVSNTQLSTNTIIDVTGLTKNTEYEVSVIGTKADGSSIQFVTQNITTDSVFREIQISNTVVSTPETIGTEIGSFSIDGIQAGETFTYSFVTGSGSDDNSKFEIYSGNKLKNKEALRPRKSYTIRVKAMNGNISLEKVFVITTEGVAIPVYSDKDVSITKTGNTNNAKQLTTSDFDILKLLEEGTIVVQFDEETTSSVGTFFGIVDNTKDKGFHLYSNGGTLCYQFLGGGNDATYTGAKPNLNIAELNTIAFKADKLNKVFKLFANGELVAEIPLSKFSFIKDVPDLNVAHLGLFQRKAANQYPFDGLIKFIDIYDVPLTDDELIEKTKVTASEQTSEYLFYPGDTTGSKYFRIPALYATKQGTVVAAIDARFGGAGDSPNNLDTTVKRSNDGGKTWDNATLPNLFDDYPNADGYKSGSASFIDPILLEDETANSGKGRLFMLVDAFPSGGGLFSNLNTRGTGYTDDGKYLKLHKKGETEYNYIAKPNSSGGYDVCDTSGNPTTYTLNGKYEVFSNGRALKVYQDGTNKPVAMNVFYNTSDLQALNTSYLYLTHSDDQGHTWSDPTILNGMIKDPSMVFLGTGPGRGIQLKTGKYKGRLLFPVYTYESGKPNADQYSSLIYSDDGGITWQRGEIIKTAYGGMISESVPIELPNGSIRMFGRTGNGYLAQTTSTDGGQTWQHSAELEKQLPSNDTQVSVIEYSKRIDGKIAYIVSSPEINRRKHGVIRIGLVEEEGTYSDGSPKYFIDWNKYKISVNGESDSYGYSCLTELPNGDIMVLYEGSGSSYIPYKSFTIDEISDGKAVVEEIISDDVKNVIAQIEELPDPDLTDNENIINARDAILKAQTDYDNLSAKDKLLVSQDLVQKLNTLIERLNEIPDDNTVKEIIEMIKALPDPALTDDENILKVKDAILSAKTAYDNLNDNDKLLVGNDLVQKLNTLIERLNNIPDDNAVKEVIEMIKALPDPVLTDDENILKVKDAILSAKTAYDNLNDNDKLLVGNDLVQKLNTLIKRLDKISDNDKIQKIIKMIKALPNPDTASIEEIKSSKSDIMSAKYAYDSLGLSDRKNIETDLVQKLDDLIKKLSQNMSESSINVIEMIKALPEPSASSDEDINKAKDAIISAKEVYEKLSDDDKKLIEKSISEKLDKLIEMLSKVSKGITISVKTSDDSSSKINVQANGLSSAITEEDIKAVKSGTEVKVILNVEKTNSISNEDKIKLTELLNKVESTKIGTYLNINLTKHIGQEKTEIENVPTNITITVEIPSDMLNGSNYQVFRIHNDETADLETKKIGNKLQFETDRFSIYAIAYTPATGGNDGGGNDGGGNNTGSTGNDSDNSSSSDSSSSSTDDSVTDNEYNFWKNTTNKINSSKSGDTVKVQPNNYTKMPVSVVNALKNRDITLTLNYLKYDISINGRSVGDLNTKNTYYDMEMKILNESNISKLTDNTELLQFKFNNNENFPFVLNITTNLSSDYNDKNVYIYNYNRSENKLEYLNATVTDKKGNISCELSYGNTFAITDSIIKGTFVEYKPQDTSDINSIVPMYNEKGKDIIVSMSKVIDGNICFTAPKTAIYNYKSNVKMFNDISEHWAKKDIDFVTQRELFAGIDENKFDPNNTMTRGMFVTVIGRLSGIEATSKSTFTDVSNDSYYSSYVSWAAENGIVSGIGNNMFAPDKSVTREEMAVIMSNYSDLMGFKLTNDGSNITFADQDEISSWATNSINTMQNAGLLTGKNNNIFDSKGSATRAEVSSLLKRFIEKSISTSK